MNWSDWKKLKIKNEEHGEFSVQARCATIDTNYGPELRVEMKFAGYTFHSQECAGMHTQCCWLLNDWFEEDEE